MLKSIGWLGLLSVGSLAALSPTSGLRLEIVLFSQPCLCLRENLKWAVLRAGNCLAPEAA